MTEIHLLAADIFDLSTLKQARLPVVRMPSYPNIMGEGGALNGCVFVHSELSQEYGGNAWYASPFGDGEWRAGLTGPNEYMANPRWRERLLLLKLAGPRLFISFVLRTHQASVSLFAVLSFTPRSSRHVLRKHKRYCTRHATTKRR